MTEEPPRVLELPRALGVPPALRLPRALGLPQELPLPRELRLQRDPELSQADEPSPVSPPPTARRPAQRTVPAAAGPSLEGAPGGERPSAVGAGSVPRAQPGPARARRSRPPVRSGRWVAAIATAGLLAVLAGTGHHDDATPTGPPSPSPWGTASASPSPATPDSAVGMPIPGGDVPVRPIRVVLSVRRGALPTSERRTLARWIRTTQHPRTRIRVVRDDRLSPPLDAGTLRDGALDLRRDASAPTHAAAWLRRGARRHRAGIYLSIGGAAAQWLPDDPRLRFAAVAVRRSDAHVHRQLAARIARQIMVTARQRRIGVTAP